MERKRVRQACARCRRQKLRCDNTRPCQLCVRSGFECQDAVGKPRRSNRARIPKQSESRQVQEVNVPNSPSPSHDTETHDAGVTLLEFATPIAGAEPRADPSGPSSRPVEHRGNSLLDPSCSTSSTALPKQERSSTFSLVEKLFKSYSSRPTCSDAIPGGSPLGVSQGTRLASVQSLIGIRLPPTPIVETLLDTYMSSCHWYITLFHEPSFRNELKPILRDHLAQESQKPFLMFLLTVLLSSARFCEEDKIMRVHPEYEYTAAQASWMAAVESNFLSCVEKMTLYDLGSMFLLATLYLNRRKPSLAFSVIGMLVRGAQAIELHKEASWGTIDPIERHVRRLVWWSIYKAELYSAQAYGKPSSLNESDIQVSMPIDLDSTAKQCPGFGTLERREDGSMQPVTILSYNRHKAELYLISAPITRNMYFKSNNRLDDILQQVQEVHRRLLRWEKQIPPELRISSFTHFTREIKEDPIVRIFALQALTLQAAYDNIQILLFRPFIGYQKPVPSLHIPTPSSFQTSTHPPTHHSHNNYSSILHTSRTQCLISSTRLSQLPSYNPLLTILERTTPFAQWISYAFNGGVMLSVLALSNLGNEKRVQRCKKGIARLVRGLREARIRSGSVAREQVRRILTDLLGLVAREEVAVLVRGNEGQGEEEEEEEEFHVPDFGEPGDWGCASFEGVGLSSAGGGERDTRESQGRTRNNETQHVVLNVNESTISTSTQNSSNTISPRSTEQIPPAIFPDYMGPSSNLYRRDESSRIPETGEGINTQIEWWRDPNLEVIAQTWMWNDSFSFL